LKRFISGRYQSFIDGLTEQDIPETSARSYRTPLNKVKLFLQNGVTYWWYIVAGEKVAQQIIRFQVISYYMDLEEELERIDYGNLTENSFKNLTDQEKLIVYEKHFWEDYLDSFFSKHMSVEASNNIGYIGGGDNKSGLYGMMKDWWMSTDGREMMRSEMLEAKEVLYDQFKTKDPADESPNQKQPQWFAKGDSPWDDGSVGYADEVDVPRSEDK